MFDNIKLNNFTIVGIDPGISHLGMSAISVTPDLSKIDAIYFQTNDGDKADLEYITTTTIEERFTKILHHKRVLKRWFDRHNPSFVIYEKPFIHGNRPTAFGALVESIMCIKQACYEFNPFIDIYEYTPLNIKKSVHAQNYQGKNFMTDALINIPEIKPFIENYLGFIDEHSIDSIAIAYTHLINLREGLV